VVTKKKDMPAFIDLFAGCGGMSLGLENAGFMPVYVNELNPDALETYLVNRRDYYQDLDHFKSNDIKELVGNKRKGLKNLKQKLKKYKIDPDQISLIVGGPPCQGYSGIGHRRSHSIDKRDVPSNTLYKDMAVVIEFFKPRIFLFENVKGLLSSRWRKNGAKGEVFKDVLKTFKKIPGYNVRWDVLYAKDYGVPQNRPRVFIVGFREDIPPSPEAILLDDPGEKPDAVEVKFLPVKENNGHVHLEDLLGDLVDERYEPGQDKTDTYPANAKEGIQTKIRRRSRKARTSMKKGDKLLEHEYSNHLERIQKKFAFMIEHGLDNKKLPPKYRTKKFAQRVLPARWENGSGPWMTATSLPDDYVHFKQPRSLTVREWARIQMFPDWYRFVGKRTTGGIRRAGRPGENIHDRELPKYTQIGNAVPVKLAEAIGKHFLKILKKN
tara:strand:+ start:166 stop:1479 length:1314 start_codon:yes stop_codon:yes gene_type:complete